VAGCRGGGTARQHHPLVVPRACGVTSTPRPLGFTASSLGYWVARSSRAMTTEGWRDEGGRRAAEVSGRKAVERPPLVIPRACGVTSTPRPLGFYCVVSGILDRPVKPGDDGRAETRVFKQQARSVSSERPPLVIPRACGVTSTPRPLGFTALSLGYWVARSSRAMTTEGWREEGDDRGVDASFQTAALFARHTTAFSRHDASEFCQAIPPNEIRGRGECRVPNAPAASCALCSGSMHTSIHSGGTGNIRHSPRNGFTAYTCSPR
jgi:hypothetical protein